jgi:hypothetical protein
VKGRTDGVQVLRLVLLAMLGYISVGAAAQDIFSGYEHLFTTPKNYTVNYTGVSPQIDGNLNDKPWQNAAWTDAFVDIEGEAKQPPRYNTRAKMLWSDSCLFIAAELVEPHVWASLKKQDAIIYHDNDFEVFIDPNNDTHHYFEVEVNAFNTVLDLFMAKPYRNSGQAMLSFNVAGLKSAVNVQGTINNPRDKDKRWTVELAIPFRDIYMGNYWRAPQEGALWRINFSRVQWETEVVNSSYQKKKTADGKPLPEYNWVWSPQGVINMHFPERWGYLLFTKDSQKQNTFTLPLDEKRKQYLWLLYYKQKAFFSKSKAYASSLQDLGLQSSQVQVDGQENQLRLEATSRQFSVSITDANSTLTINDEGLVQAPKKII